MVNASGPQLLQALMNLVVNSRDAMPLGGTITLGLTADTTSSPPMAVLEVSDTGQGMSPEVSRRVFERYYTTKEVGAGTGIGLPTVHHIVQDHGGTVELTTAPGKGARFFIRLPLLPAGVHPEGRTRDSAGSAVSTGSPTACADPSPGEIRQHAAAAASSPVKPAAPRSMVIESDERVRPLIVQTLRNSGYQVVSFSSAEAGLDAFTVDPTSWAVVLVELDGERLDGVSCIRRMRRSFPALPALMLTADPGDASGHLVDAQTRVLLKPFTVGSLRSALNDLLKHPSMR
jgi:CheY-like chemotaxis protein